MTAREFEIPRDLAFDRNGLITAVCQDAGSGRVLMVGYANTESLAQTAESGFMTFYSRSRNTLWRKGETSGNVLHVVSMRTDCDRDALLVQVIAAGPTCHTGQVSCFADEAEVDARVIGNRLQRLWQLAQSRAACGTGYTGSLMQKPETAVAQKIGEEGVEVALAIATGERAEVAREAADLLYHLSVGLARAGVTYDDVARVLASRER